MKPHRRPAAAGQSMVPMADMLTNTVGIVMFILVFTVLAAGGAMVVKRLPIEHATAARPVHFLCAGDRLYHLDTALIEQLLDGAGTVSTIAEFEAWSKRLDGRQAQGRDTVATIRAGLESTGAQGARFLRPSAVVEFAPLPQGGERAAEFADPASRFRARLAALESGRHFVHFVVLPDAIDAFGKARELAIRHGLQTGWLPHAERGAVRFSLIGTGRSPIPQ